MRFFFAIGLLFQSQTEIVLAQDKSALNVTSDDSGKESGPSVELLQKIQNSNFEQDPEWIRLLHYQCSGDSCTSPVQGNHFFYSPEGRTQPKQELIETFKAFYSHRQYKEPEQHAQCHFPLRLAFVKKVLNWKGEDLPKVTCEQYRVYAERVVPKKVSVVFSSYFLGSASSVFGHTFLKLSGENENEIFDTGINYTAQPTTQNPVLYALFGMIGVFPGNYSAVPFYVKLREYNDYEARDLWTYELNLTDEEKSRLRDHIWELGESYFGYYYFTENCSYHVFNILDIAAPRLQLMKELPYYVIPSDTIRRLNQKEGLVKSIRYRPSIRSTYQERIRLLQIEENAQSQQDSTRLKSTVKSTDILKQMIRHPDDLGTRLLPQAKAQLSSLEYAKLLDTYIDYLELEFPKELVGSADHESKVWRNLILDERARLDVNTPKPEVPAPLEKAPHLGHGIRRLGLGVGVNQYQGEKTTVLGLSYKFAMTDMLDHGPGYPLNTQVDFGSLRLRAALPKSGIKILVDEFNLFTIVSLNPVSSFYHASSFEMKFGYETWRNRECQTSLQFCHGVAFRGGYGKTLALDDGQKFNLYALGAGDLEYSPHLAGPNARVLLGVDSGVLLNLSLSQRIQIQAQGRYGFWNRVNPLTLSWSAEWRSHLLSMGNSSLTMGVRYDQTPSDRQVMVQFYDLF